MRKLMGAGISAISHVKTDHALRQVVPRTAFACTCSALFHDFETSTLLRFAEKSKQ
jgi:hypothetical protein